MVEYQSDTLLVDGSSPSLSTTFSKEHMSGVYELARLALMVIHKLTMAPSSQRTKYHAEAGYLLNDLGWPEINEQLRSGTFVWPDKLDLRGFDKT